MRRSKSNLAPIEPAPEPMSGPGSAVCFCRVMARKEKAKDARMRLMERAVVEEKPAKCVLPLVHRLNRSVMRVPFGRKA